MKNEKLYSVTVVKGFLKKKTQHLMTLNQAREAAVAKGVRAVCLIEGGVS